MSGILAAVGAPPTTAAPPSGAISITDQEVERLSVTGATIAVSYSIVNDGKVKNHNSTTLETWNSNSGSVGSYEVQATLSSGATPSGTLGAWLNCGTTRTWELTATAGESKTCILLVSIRDVATATVQDSASITLTAASDSGGTL